MNQNPEQKARDNIDRQLAACGWVIQNKQQINLFAGSGVAVREYQTSSGPVDYLLFVDQKPVGVIEAKKEEEGHKITVVEEQSADYADRQRKVWAHAGLDRGYHCQHQYAVHAYAAQYIGEKHG